LLGLGLPRERAGSTRRAALRLAGAAAFDKSLDPKRRKKWERQARRLAAQGRLETIAGAAAVEAFLTVEPKGWKGARGTSLTDDPARLAFARAALDAFARAGRLDAMALVLDGRPVAAGLVLIAGARGFYWKTGYDEAFSEASPGVQLTRAHSRRLAETPGLALLDSCANEDHPMIGRVWRDELSFDDWALGTGRALRFWLWLERARARAREEVKRVLYRILRRKRT
jgi:CelD/BcsL family acetyltransferase involved in cellulose biosynthesis